MSIKETIDAIIRDIGELPDYDSPDEWPNAMMATADELRLILERHLAPTPTQAVSEPVAWLSVLAEARSGLGAGGRNHGDQAFIDYGVALIDHIEEKLTAAYPASTTAQESEPAAQQASVAAEWGYAKTVGNAIAQLQTFNPATPIYGALHLDDGRCIARGLTFSRERVVGERWIDNRDDSVPYSIVAWTQTKDPADRAAAQQAAEAPVANEDEQERQESIDWQELQTEHERQLDDLHETITRMEANCKDAYRYGFLRSQAYKGVLPHGHSIDGHRTAWITKFYPGDTFDTAVDAAIDKVEAIDAARTPPASNSAGHEEQKHG